MSDTPDVTSTLAELERKLRELEQELTSIGRRREQPTEVAFETQALPEPGGRLIDEQSERVESPVASGAPRAPVESAEQPAGPSEAQPAGPSEAQLASLADLRRFRDRLERFAKELTEDYDALLGRVMSSFSARSPQPGTDLEPEPAPPRTPSPHEETLFEGRVELGVGPFYDIASLGAFEQQLAELPYVIEASVRRFEASHAVIDLRLAAPVALVGELRRALDGDFGVRQVAGGRILLTFDDV
jgi:hypothetical protein